MGVNRKRAEETAQAWKEFNVLADNARRHGYVHLVEFTKPRDGASAPIVYRQLDKLKTMLRAVGMFIPIVYLIVHFLF